MIAARNAPTEGGPPAPGDGSSLRVLIVAENASARFGGESILPLHYFRILRSRGVDAWMIVHERTRAELTELLPAEIDRVHFVPETALDLLVFRISRFMPKPLHDLSFAFLGRLFTLRAARRAARRLVAELGIDVVHHPTPVSPKDPSVIHGLGAPVVMGPMNGGMSYPPGLVNREGRLTTAIIWAGRTIAPLLIALMPGRRLAATLLVSNERTRCALPRGCRGEVITLVENGVDLSTWNPPAIESQSECEGEHEAPARFVFVGRLIDWKGVDMLLDAVARVVKQRPVALEIIGEGPLRGALEAQARELGLDRSVTFTGWVTQAECARRLSRAEALVLPSLRECGGAVVLEAMACGLPVIATHWGGPADYLDETCGILVEPTSREALVAGLADGIARLADSPETRKAMGNAGRQRIEREFDWERKVDRMVQVYEQTVARASSRAKSPAATID